MVKQNLNEKYAFIIGKEIPGSWLTIVKILDETSTDGAYSRMCLAKCRCGRIIKRKLESVLRKHNHSCGLCGYKSQKVSMACLNDLSGRVIGNLRVIRRANRIGETRNGKRSVYYECECLYKGCGNHVIARSDAIQDGSVSSCGRCGYEQDRKLRKTPRAVPITDEEALRRRFAGIKQRCYNPKSAEYVNYGARGICVCDEWLSDRTAFVKWAVENGFSQDLTIERVDVNGPYAPWNCRWIPMSEQSLNTRQCRFIDVSGIPMPVAQCSRLVGIDPRRGSEMSPEELSKRASREYLHKKFVNILERSDT